MALNFSFLRAKVTTHIYARIYWLRREGKYNEMLISLNLELQ